MSKLYMWPFLLLVLPIFVLSHGGGFSVKAAYGNYETDIHYSRKLTVGDPTWFNFFLTDRLSKNNVLFHDVDIALLDERGDAVFKTNILRKTGQGTGIIVTMPRSGKFVFDVDFKNNHNETISHSVLPVNVKSEGFFSGLADKVSSYWYKISTLFKLI